VLRGAFARWGTPRALRLDNGIPWGGWNDLPTALALWLAGLGLSLTFNPPCRPQHNGVVEKSQDTAQRWAEPGACRSAEELQGRLDEEDLVQRQKYPIEDNKSRMEIFPGLAHSGRSYTQAREAQQWSLALAEEYLSGWLARRRVSSQGRLSLYGWPVYVGAAHKGAVVLVSYDPCQHAWLVQDDQGRQLRSQREPQVSRDSVVRLTLTGGTGRPHRAGSGKTVSGFTAQPHDV
jgi:hypothetical protein